MSTESQSVFIRFLWNKTGVMLVNLLANLSLDQDMVVLIRKGLRNEVKPDLLNRIRGFGNC
jgi:hypothetical protein